MNTRTPFTVRFRGNNWAIGRQYLPCIYIIFVQYECTIIIPFTELTVIKSMWWMGWSLTRLEMEQICWYYRERSLVVIKKRGEEIVLLARRSRGHTYWITNKNVLIGEASLISKQTFWFLHSSWISWYNKRMPNWQHRTRNSGPKATVATLNLHAPSILGHHWWQGRVLI